MIKQDTLDLSDVVIRFNTLVASVDSDTWQEGMSWYEKAQTDCRLAYEDLLKTCRVNCDFEKFCQVVAILSPATEWGRNIEAAKSLVSQVFSLVGIDSIKPTGTRYYANQKKAYKVLSGEIVFESTGTGKTFAFYKNLYNPAEKEYITIDFHIWNAANGWRITWADWSKNQTVSKENYRIISNAIRIVASQYNILPLQVQAIIWLAQKGNG